MGITTEYQACAMCDECGENYVEAFWTQTVDKGEK